MPARDRAGRDAGRGEPNRETLDRPRRHHAARMQDQEVAVVAAGDEAFLELPNVVADDGREHRVRDRRREPLVLEDLGQDVARERDPRVGKLGGQDVSSSARAPDWRRSSRSRPRQTRPLAASAFGRATVPPPRRAARAPAPSNRPFRDLETIAPPDVRRRHVVRVPQLVLPAAPISITSRKPFVVTMAALGRSRVIEAHSSRPWSCARTPRPGRGRPPRLDSAQDPVDRIGRGRRLRHGHHTGLLVEHTDVRERSADVDRDAFRLASRSRRPSLLFRLRAHSWLSLRRAACRGGRVREGRYHLAREELHGSHRICSGHARDVHPADDLRRSELVTVALDLANGVVRIADDESVLETLEVDLTLIGDQLARVDSELPFPLGRPCSVQLAEQIFDAGAASASASRCDSAMNTSRMTGRSDTSKPIRAAACS